MRSKSIRFMAIGLTVLATEVANAVGISEVTVKDGVITIGTDANFAKFEGWLPWLKPYSNGHAWGTDQKAVLWTNRKLADIKALRSKMSGAWLNGLVFDGRGLITKRSDDRLEIQFQCQDGSLCKGVLAYLEQDGDNIVGWAKQAGYSTEVKTGAPIPSFGLQVSSAKDNGAYGVYGIEVENTLETTPAELKALAASVGEAGTDTLTVNGGVLAIRPTEPNEVFDLDITGNAVVCFAKGVGTQELETLGGGGILTTEARTILPGYRLADVEFVSAKTGGSWMGIDEAQIHYMNQSADKWTFQAQKTGSGWTQCVLVELADAAEGVQGRIVWGRYKANASCPLGSDFTAIDGYYTYKTVPNDMQASLSALVLKVPPSLVFSSTKSNWTTWGTIFDGGTVRVREKPLQSNPRTFVTHGGVLRLEVNGGAWWGGDSRFYTVGKDSCIVLATGLAMADGATLTLDGGQIQVLDGFNYVNDLAITNGGGWVGAQCCRAGYAKDVTWNIDGPEPVTIEPGLELVNDSGGRFITLNTQTDTVMMGALQDAGNYAGATFAKDGCAKLTLGSGNANAGPFKVVAGELVFANSAGIRSNNALVLAGGKVSLGADATGVSAGVLTLSGSAALDATNGTFAFADSHEAIWAEDAVLTLVCDPSKQGRKNRFRFGTTTDGLTADQLSRVRYDESVTTRRVTFTLDAEGYLCDDLDQGFTLRIR